MVLPVSGGVAGDAHAGVEAQNLVAAERHFRPQFVAFAVQQEDAGAVAIQQVGGFARDQIEQAAEVALRVHLLANGQDGGKFFIDLGLRDRRHGYSVYRIDVPVSIRYTACLHSLRF